MRRDTSAPLKTCRKCLTLVLPTSVLAQKPPASDKTEAKAELTPQSTQELFNAAKEARNAGNLLEAIKLLQQIYEREPAPSLLNNIGKLYEGLGWYKAAVEAYQKVADDTEAEMGLRTLDASRVAALKPKLGKAWLKLELTPLTTQVWVNGKSESDWSSRELAVDPGKVVIELREPLAKTSRLIVTPLPSDKRTTITLAVTDDVSKTHGTLNLPESRTKLTGILYGTVALAEPVNSLESIQIPAGNANVQFQFPEETLRQTLNVNAGTASALELKLTPKLPATLPEGKASDSPVLNWILMGSGAALLGAGTGLYINGQMQADDLNQAIANETPITSFSQQEANDIRDSANLQGPLGVSLATVGVGALVTGLILYLTSDPQPEATEAIQLNSNLDGSVEMHVRW